MKTILATATVLLLLVALPGPARAGGHHGHRSAPWHEAPAPDRGADRNNDGRITNLERIRYEQQQRFERLHGGGLKAPANDR